MHTLKVTFLLILLSFQFPVFSQDSTTVFSCGFDESELDLSILKNIDTRNFKVSEDGFYVARIAIDIDYDTYQHFDFNEELIRFELNKMIQKVSMLYEKEINTKLNVSEVHIWKSENDDPYKNEFDIYRMLSLLRENVLQNKIFSQDFDFYMYLPTKNFLGAGGLASANGNVSPWGQFKTMAHEIGHNFGSPHTQSCSWENGPLDFCYPAEGTCYENAIDDKLGTVMSYCSSTMSSFHPEARNLIRAYASQNLRFIDEVPPSPVLETAVTNSQNVPYYSFKPVSEANTYYYEIALNSTFDNILFSDTTSFSSIYFNEYANYAQYYFRVKAINDNGTSPWSNISKITRESNKLAIPVPEDTFNKKYIDFSANSDDRLNFSAVQNAEGYEIEILQYSGSFIPVRNYFSYNYKSTFNFTLVSKAASFFGSDFMWRVRAYKGNETGAWSEFQYIFNKTESIYSNFNLRSPLPTSFTIIRNDFSQTSTNYTLQKTDNNQTIDIPEANIQKEKNRFIFQNLAPNSTYKLTKEVSSGNYLIWGEKAEGFQYTTERVLTTSNESLPNNWELFSTKDSTTELRTYERKLSNKYMFVETNNGLLRHNLNNDDTQAFNTENTNGLIGNQIRMLEIDNENNLWLFQQVSKRLDFSGVFPDPVYSLMKFNPDNMNLLQRIDFEYADAAELLSFDPDRMLFSTDSRLLKLNNNRLEFFFDLSEIKNSYSQSYTWSFNSDKYWLRGVPNNSSYSELIAINLNDLSTEVFNHKTYPNCPINFSGVFFDKLGKPLILNPDNNNVLKLEGNQFNIEANLAYQNGYFSNLTYQNGIFTARIYSNEPGIYKFYNSEWNKVSEYPDYIFGFYDNFTDQTGNVWLNTYNTLIKLDVCSEISQPVVSAETEVAYGNPTTINVSGCSALNWSFNNLDGEITNDNLTSKTIKPKASFSYQISCNDNGCTSNPVQGNVAVVPKLLVNTAVSNTICSNDIIRYTPTIQGQYSAENQFSVILSNNVGQNFQINGNEVAEGPYLLDNAIPAGTYWTKLKSSHPESFSSDSVLVNIVKSANVNITGVSDICNGESGSLTAEVTGNGPFNYFWADDQAQILSRGVNFPITTSGTYQLAVLDANGCTFISDLIISKVIDLGGSISTEGSTELASGQTVNLLVDYNAGWAYEWKLNNESTNFGSTNLVTVSQPGIYTVKIKKGSCVFETEGVQIKQILASMEEKPEWEVKIAPNPAEKYLHITLPLNNSALVSFKLLSTEGKILKTWQSSSRVQRIDISSLKAGLYYLKSQTDNKMSTKKFIRN